MTLIQTYLLLQAMFIGHYPVDADLAMSNNYKGKAIKYYVKFNEEKALVRYADRNEQVAIGSFIKNTHINQDDFHAALQIINQKDRFKQELNERYQPGISSTGALLKKRPQSLMHDLDPYTPVSDEIDDERAEPGTNGYFSEAHIDFKGLHVGDTIMVITNSGLDTERKLTQFIVSSAKIDAYGRQTLTVPMGQDNKTSSILGVMVKFGDHQSAKFGAGTVSYALQIVREVRLPSPPSAKPISKRRARRR